MARGDRPWVAPAQPHALPASNANQRLFNTQRGPPLTCEGRNRSNMTTISVSEPTTFDALSFATHALSSPRTLAAVIDHTLLKPEATRTQIQHHCAEAAEYGFACAMVNPTWVETSVQALAGTGVRVGVVVGFPLGATLSASKREETAQVLQLGALDVDMVLNV